MKIKNVVFDIGGVILTFLPYDIIKTYSESKEEEKLLVDLFHSDLWRKMDAGTVLVSEIGKIYEQRTGLPEARTTGLLDTIFDGLNILPQTEHFIQKLLDSNINVYYLSNMSEHFMSKLLEKYDIFQKMAGGVYSADVQLIKPDVGIYKTFDERFKTEPSETIFLDDLEKNIEAAKNFGWHGEVYHEHNCDEVINKLSKIMKI